MDIELKELGEYKASKIHPEAFSETYLKGWNDCLEYFPKDNWISVEDRLPDGDGIFDVWFEGATKSARANYWAEGDVRWSENLDNLWSASPITHWQPIPPPPAQKDTE